jgi:hypothetical protein
MKGKKVFVESTSDLNIKSGGVGNMTSAKKLSLKGQNAALQGAIIDLPAAQINMQSGSATSASGAGLTGGGVIGNSEDVADAALANQDIANTVAAAAATDAAAAAALEEVTVTGKRAAESTLGSSIGKAFSGLTSTVSNVFTKVTSAADNVLKDFAGKTPLGEIQQKLTNLENMSNQTKGEILSLKDNLKNTVTNKLGEVSDKAIERNLEFNVDPELLPQKAVNTIKTVIGKHIYPLTETKTTGDG